MENKRVILGLDVSTSCIGATIMVVEGNSEPKILKITHVSPKISSKIKGIESLFLKRNIFEEEFLNEYKEYGITEVVIEEPLLGSNNINTISILLKFNTLIADSIYKILNIVPKYISSYDARAYSFPQLISVRKLNKKGEAHPIKQIKKALKDDHLVLFGGYKFDVAKKDVLLGFISDKYPDIEWIYNKDGELKKENFDASDSAVCCLGYINKEKNGLMSPKVLTINETGNQIEYDVLIWDRIYKHKIEF